MPATLEKPRFVSMTIRLDNSLRDRLKALSVAKNRIIQSLMREAISIYLDKEEIEYSTIGHIPNKQTAKLLLASDAEKDYKRIDNVSDLSK
jgi:hypothetical protein